MKWQVTIDDDIQNIDLPNDSTASDLVKHLDLHPDSLLAVSYTHLTLPTKRIV